MNLCSCKRMWGGAGFPVPNNSSGSRPFGPQSGLCSSENFSLKSPVPVDTRGCWMLRKTSTSLRRSWSRNTANFVDSWSRAVMPNDDCHRSTLSRGGIDTITTATDVLRVTRAVRLSTFIFSNFIVNDSPGHAVSNYSTIIIFIHQINGRHAPWFFNRLRRYISFVLTYLLTYISIGNATRKIKLN